MLPVCQGTPVEADVISCDMAMVLVVSEVHLGSVFPPSGLLSLTASAENALSYRFLNSS